MIAIEAIINIPDYDGIGIYMLRDNVDGKVYIGSSKNIHRRITHHNYMLKNGKASKKMNAAYAKGHTFTFELLEQIDYGKNAFYVFEREKQYIKEYDSTVNGLNTEKSTTISEPSLMESAKKDKYWEQIYNSKKEPIYKHTKRKYHKWTKEDELNLPKRISFRTTVKYYNLFCKYAESKGKSTEDILNEYIITCTNDMQNEQKNTKALQTQTKHDTIEREV